MKINNITLRQLTLDDFETVLTWSQNETFCRANGWELNRDREEVYSWWKNLVNHPPKDFVRLGIELNEKLIGYTDLAFIGDQSAELGIAIGETKLWGKNLGYQAAQLMIEYGIQHLGLTIVYAETHETNQRSRKMLERLGFEQVSIEGTENYMGEETRLVQYALKVIN